jgi:hypothetical protein
MCRRLSVLASAGALALVGSLARCRRRPGGLGR